MLCRTMICAGLAAVIAGSAARAQPPQDYALSLTREEVSYIAAQLRERPYKEVASLLDKMQGQITAQEKVIADAKAKAQEDAKAAFMKKLEPDAKDEPAKPAEPAPPPP